MSDSNKEIEKLNYLVFELKKTNKKLADSESKIIKFEQSLHESNKRFTAVTESIPDAVLSIDRTNKIRLWTESAEKIFGYKKNEVTGKPSHILMPARFRNINKKIMDEFINGNSNLTLGVNDKIFCLKKNGTEFPVEISYSCWGGNDDNYFCAIIRDITERVLSFKELQLQRNLFESIFYSTLDLISLKDEKLTYKFADNAFCEFLDKDLNEIVGKTDNILFKSNDFGKHRSSDLMVLKSGQINDFEMEINGSAGKRLMHVSKVPVLSDSNTCKEILCTMHDITEMRSAQDVSHYKELFENVADGVFIMKLNGKLIEANDTAVQMTGYSKKELLNMNIKNIVNRGQVHTIQNILSDIKTEKLLNFEFELKSNTGDIIPIEANSKLIPYLGNESILCVARDVNETKLLQKNLIKSERLAATGQLAASIAHEINSPLQGITTLINVIMKTEGNEKDLSNNIELIRDAFNSIKNTVQKLLDLNRPSMEKWQTANINDIIIETVELLKGHLDKNRVNITLNLSSRVPEFRVSLQQLKQVFINLINNSVEAMIGISRQRNVNSKDREREIILNSNRRKGNIIITVKDTGPGISEEDMDHIFDPFYTKKKKMGVGAGLSICHGIIENHKGSISVKNSPEGGAVFTIIIPEY